MSDRSNSHLDLVFPAPNDCRPHPDVARARQHNIEWLQGHGVLAVDDQAVKRYVEGGFATAIAMTYPLAQGEDLDLIVDTVSWILTFDDALAHSEIGADPRHVVPLRDALIAALDSAPHRGTLLMAPFVDAFRDIWPRACDGMSPAWRARVRGGLERYFHACAQEVHDRSQNVLPDLAGYVESRRHQQGLDTCVNMTERVEHFELPEQVVASPEYATLLDGYFAVQVPLFDLTSFAKEEHLGELNNIVFLVEGTRKCSRAQAIAETRARTQSGLDEFWRIQQHAIPRLCDRLELTAPQRGFMQRYLAGMNRTVWIAIWAADSSGRYLDDGDHTRVDRVRYLGDFAYTDTAPGSH